MDSEKNWMLDHEIKEIRTALNTLDNRLRMVEASVKAPAKDVAVQANILSQPPEEIKVKPQPVAIEATGWNAFESVAKASSEPKLSLETRIGEYWLNKLGVISLVIGVVFLILYSFQYFGAPLKLLTGAIVSVVLIGFGEKIARSEERKWYGQSLMGGGWALAYFIVYAMYFIPDLKLIDYYPLDFGLLTGL